MRPLPWAFLFVLGACTSAPSPTTPSLAERCLAECDRAAANPSCTPDSCRALCGEPGVVGCEAELDAVLDCTEPMGVEALCGGSEPVCAAQSRVLGSCIFGIPLDAGPGSDARP